MPPLILLHGFTGAPRSWIAVLECLGPERDVAVLALAGHVGRSVRGTLGSLRPVLASTAAESAAQARPTSFAHAVTELARELGSLGIAAGATVCGYSLGARLALALLCAHPALFTEAVLISGSAGLADPAERARRKTADAGIVNQLRQGSLSQFVDDWQAHPTLEVAGRVASSLLEEQRAVRLAQQAAGLACSLESCGLGEMPDLRPEIGKIGARVRYVSGALDSKFSQHAAELCTLTPGAEQVTLAGVGHNPLLECPERIAALLDEPCRSLGNAHASA